MVLIDLFVIFFVSKWFGEKADDKGHNRHLFQGLAIAAWFTGEVAAVFTVLIAVRLAIDVQLSTWIESLSIGLGGGAAGLLVIFIIIRCLPDRETAAGGNGAGAWACPACGFKNNERRRRCFKCGIEKPPVPEADALAQAWTCPECGGRNLASGDFCYKCKAQPPVRR